MRGPRKHLLTRMLRVSSISLLGPRMISGVQNGDRMRYGQVDQKSSWDGKEKSDLTGNGFINSLYGEPELADLKLLQVRYPRFPVPSQSS
jgi:hypothetical protein